MADLEAAVLHCLIRRFHDGTYEILGIMGQVVTVPMVSDKRGRIVGFDVDDVSIGVLFEGAELPIYYDADMVKPVE